MALIARSRGRPMASSTPDGSGSAAWQAAPVDAATCGVADSMCWPLTPSMLTLRVLGSRSLGWPLGRTAPGSRSSSGAVLIAKGHPGSALVGLRDAWAAMAGA
jgi:hypothetical protein